MVSEKNKRIAKNTLALYARMFLTLIIGLYTSRVILANLGIEDYGIYNVVGSIVASMTFLNGTMATATSRYITVSVGKENQAYIKKIFSNALSIHYILAAIVAVLCEIVGYWFIVSKLVIPVDRMDAAIWVFHCSVITLFVDIISIPYNSMIIAKEKITAFAYIGMFEVIMKLIIVFSLTLSPFDKLKVYAILLLLLAMIIRLIYIHYSRKNFEEAHVRLSIDKSISRSMFSFAGWNIIGSTAYIAKNQGVNIVINLFFGPAVNAARGLANTVNSAVNGFVTNAQTAISPAVMKYQATEEKDEMYKLMCKGSKFSFYIILLIASPIIFSLNYILKLWLVNYPDYTSDFIVLIIVNSMIDSLYATLLSAHLATGKIKDLQIFIGINNLLIVPLVYFAFYYIHYPPLSVIITIIISAINIFIRIHLYSKVDRDFSKKYFARKVILPVLVTSIMSCILPLIMLFVVGCETTNFITLTIYSALVLLNVILVIVIFGLTNNERRNIYKMIKNKTKNGFPF